MVRTRRMAAVAWGIFALSACSGTDFAGGGAGKSSADKQQSDGDAHAEGDDEASGTGTGTLGAGGDTATETTASLDLETAWQPFTGADVEVKVATSKINLESAIACPPGGDADPLTFKHGKNFDGTKRTGAFAEAGKDVEFFYPTSDMMSQGPGVVVGLWTTRATPDPTRHLPSDVNWIPVAHGRSGEVKGKAIKAQPALGLYPDVSDADYPGKLVDSLPGVGRAAGSIELALRRGIANVIDANRLTGDKSPLYLYAGAQFCNEVRDADGAQSRPGLDLILRFFGRNLADDLGAITAEGKYLNMETMSTAWGFEAGKISATVTQNSPKAADKGFGKRTPYAAARALLAAATYEEAMAARVAGGAGTVRDVISGIKMHLDNGSACAELGSVMGGDRAWWEGHAAAWDSLGLELACALLNRGPEGDFAGLVGGLKSAFETRRKVIAARLIRSAVFVSMAASLPGDWLRRPKCFKDGLYVNQVLYSHVIPLEVKDGKVRVIAQQYPKDDSQLRHPESNFAIAHYQNYFVPNGGGNLQTVFGMVTYNGLLNLGTGSAIVNPGVSGFVGVVVNMTTDTTKLAARLDAGAEVTVDEATFLTKDINLKTFLRWLIPCTTQGKTYCQAVPEVAIPLRAKGA